MPRDMAAFAEQDATPENAGAVIDFPTVASGPHIGAALRAGRARRGLSVEDVAEATYIRRAYISAIEELDIEHLPARPFVNGYIRSYAKLLGFDPEQAVARFREDAPDPEEPFRAPVGVARGGRPRLIAVSGAAVAVITSIVLWNIARHAMSDEPPETKGPDAAIVAAASADPGPMVLGAPLPPPSESTTPPDYETPGLAAASQPGGSLYGKIPAIPVAPPGPASAKPVGAPFTPAGKIYGPPAAPGMAVLQAARGGALVVRGADGSVHFARQLAAGEAFRLPQTPGLTLFAPDPTSIEVYQDGRFVGVLAQQTMPAGKLALTTG